MTERKTYKIGTYVEIVSVDTNGLQGRDPHPPKWLEGHTGIVIGRPVEEQDVDGFWTLIFYPVRIGDYTFMFADYELN